MPRGHHFELPGLSSILRSLPDMQGACEQAADIGLLSIRRRETLEQTRAYARRLLPRQLEGDKPSPPNQGDNALSFRRTQSRRKREPR